MRIFTSILLASAALGLAACGDDDTTESASTPPTPAVAATTPATTPAAATDDVDVKEGECADVTPTPKDPDTPEPTGSLDSDKKYTVTLKTSCGTIEIVLNVKENPKTANAFATLVKAGYYDGTPFHRVVPGFVVQGGDPLGNGTGGPSWKVVEAPPEGTTYDRGVVAMAKTAADAPGTTQSQFFIVTGDNAGLPAEYAVAGRVDEGMNIADAISDLGEEGSDGPPSKAVTVIKATLAEN